MNKQVLFLSLVLFLVFVIATAPARVLVRLLPADLPLQFAGVSGTLWQGSATSITFKRQVFNNARWDLNSTSLLFGKVAGEIEMKDNRFNLASDFEVLFDQTVRLSNAVITANANQLSPFLPLKSILVDGRLRVDLDSLSFSAKVGPSDISGQFEWLRAKASISGPLIDLGTFRASFSSTEANTTLFTLDKTNNVLDLTGTAELAWPSSVTLDMTTSDQVPSGLQNVIVFLKKNQQGRRQLSMTIPLQRK
ncbi:MAG: type II secretion system protein N [Kangiellaceae bacterium]|jgi:hypothetical protein|nr:type II secretion system protein N [Kangiellaceae bacterium]